MIVPVAVNWVNRPEYQSTIKVNKTVLLTSNEAQDFESYGWFVAQCEYFSAVREEGIIGLK